MTVPQRLIVFVLGISVHRYYCAIFSSGRTIERELEHLVEVRLTRPVRTAFEIIAYFKCEISGK